jgi:CheY-like chemotaxis protein
VIEDDRADQSWMVRVLTEAGYQVVTAATCADAEARSRERAFDGITLDLLLPDGSGWDFLRTIRREGKNRDTPVVIATVVAEKGVAAGFAVHDFLVKPLPAEQLLESLRRVACERPGPHSVLVVDDDPNSLKLMELKLKEAGFGSICALDSRRGLEVALQQHPAAVVLDLIMPGMDGFEFLARLHQSEVGRVIPVIIWTGRDLTVAEKARLASVAHAVFLKGQAGPEALLGELRNHLSGVSKNRVEGIH